MEHYRSQPIFYLIPERKYVAFWGNFGRNRALLSVNGLSVMLNFLFKEELLGY